MDASQLVTLAMQKTGKSSQNQIAAVLGVSHVAVGKWMRSETCPTFEQAAELAVLAGLPPVATAAEVRQHSPDGARHKALLKRMASLAAGVTLVVGLGVTTTSPAHAQDAGFSARNPSHVYIM